MKTKYNYSLTIVILIFCFFGCKQKAEYNNPISENITFENNEDDIKLSGTLSLPNEKGIFPAVILIRGNGEHKRDAEFGNHKPFLDISNHLTKKGIAVLLSLIHI